MGNNRPMGRELQVIWAGRPRRSEIDELCRGYRRRIGRFTAVRDRPVKVGGGGDDVTRRRREAEALTAALPDPGWVVALDEGGEQMTSTAFAAWLQRRRQSWPHPLVFVVGSDLGLEPALRRRARKVLSLGPMTFPHELARLLLYEQLYRALAIAAGINYHRPRF